jgi:chemotaxis regulatin CheY-phosphate phosphatase CheZ
MAFQSSVTMSHPQCDTYLEEPAADRTRENAKIVASQWQDIMANELSTITADEYLKDMLEHMDRMEVRTLVYVT